MPLETVQSIEIGLIERGTCVLMATLRLIVFTIGTLVLIPVCSGAVLAFIRANHRLVYGAPIIGQLSQELPGPSVAADRRVGERRAGQAFDGATGFNRDHRLSL